MGVKPTMFPTYFPAMPPPASGAAGVYAFQELVKLSASLYGISRALDMGSLPGQLVTHDFYYQGTIADGAEGGFAIRSALGECRPVALDISADSLTVTADAVVTIEVTVDFMAPGEVTWTPILETSPASLTEAAPGPLMIREEADFAVEKIPDESKLRAWLSASITLNAGSATVRGLHVRLYCRQSDRAEGPTMGNRKGT